LRIPKRKTALYSAERKILSQTENKLVLGIPLVRGLSDVVVQPQVVVITFHVEDARVAVRIGYVRHTIHATALLKEVGLYFMCDQKSSSTPHQVFSFFGQPRTSSAGSHNRLRSQCARAEEVSKSRNRSMQPICNKYIKKVCRPKKKSKDQKAKGQTEENTKILSFSCADGKQTRPRDSTRTWAQRS